MDSLAIYTVHIMCPAISAKVQKIVKSIKHLVFF